MKRQLMFVLALSGCAHTQVERLSASQYLVQCAAAARCYRAAAAACEGPYDVLSGGSETRGVSVIGTTAVVHRRTTMLVRCEGVRQSVALTAR